MTVLYNWAAKWGVGLAAVQDLERVFRMHGREHEPTGTARELVTGNETAVQWNVRMEAARAGLRMWRNNVGALVDERGIPVRYGLANDTKALNKEIKSADLIGIRPVTITLGHVGQTIGQFVSRECKPAAWSWAGTDRELGQLRWAQLINGLGGDAAFATGPGTF